MHLPAFAQSLIGLLTVSIYPALAIFVAASASLIALWSLGAEDVDPEEPPVVRPSIPFFGHIIGLLRHHNNYFTLLRCVRCLINTSNCT